MKMKPLEDQTIVITGASSGIGLATARKAAQAGAAVVLVARSGDELRKIERQITGGGGRAAVVEGDVADESTHRRASEAADAFGGFDTWVNDAGVSIYAEIKDTAPDDARRLFETNVLGVFHGSRVAAEGFRRRGKTAGHAGSLINIGSVLSDRAIPVQGVYSASKHAVKGFTDALRMELEHEGVAVYVTLIKPSAIDTPYAQHAKNQQENAATLPPPVYDVEVAADAILHAATHGDRDLYVGTGGAMLAKMGQWAPRLTDKIMEAGFFAPQQGPIEEVAPGANALHAPGGGRYGRERGGIAERGGTVLRHSLYNSAAAHPAATTVGVLALGAVALGLYGAFGGGGDRGLRRDGRRDSRFDERSYGVDYGGYGSGAYGSAAYDRGETSPRAGDASVADRSDPPTFAGNALDTADRDQAEAATV